MFHTIFFKEYKNVYVHLLSWTIIIAFVSDMHQEMEQSIVAYAHSHPVHVYLKGNYAIAILTNIVVCEIMILSYKHKKLFDFSLIPYTSFKVHYDDTLGKQ